MKSIQIGIILTFLLGVCSASLPFFGKMYGLQGLELQLVTIDPKTAEVTTFSAADANEFVAQQLCAIDDARELFYAIVLNPTNRSLSLVGLSLNTATIKVQIPLPFVEETFMGAGQGIDVEPKTGDVFVFGRSPSADNKHLVLRISPFSGKVVELNAIGESSVGGTTSCYDPYNEIYWIVLAPNGKIVFHGIDPNNGKVVRTVENPIMQTMEFDPVTGLIYGFGLEMLNSTVAQRTLVAFNSASGKMEVLARYPKYLYIEGAVSALDWRQRILYSYLQPQGGTNFNLVGINIQYGEIVSEPEACSAQTCPFAIEYYNKPWH